MGKDFIFGLGSSPPLSLPAAGIASIQAARRLPTMYLGPETVLLALDVQFRHHLSAADVILAFERRGRDPQQECS